MKRRSLSRGKAAKPTRSKPVKAKQSSAARSSAARISPKDPQPEATRLQRELNEALDRQAATSEVLRLISSAAGELQPVFHAILESATRICDAKFGNLWLRAGDAFRIAATHGAPRAYREYFDREPLVHPHPQSGLGVIFETGRLVHIADVQAESTFRDKMRMATIELANARSLVGVPLLKDNEVIGAIAIYRQEVRPFTDKQIELLQNFAAQAVIAIENARLLNELRESLQQQTAAAEVLKVISDSPGDLEPVFETMLRNSIKICEAGFGQMFLGGSDHVRLVAAVGVPTALVEFDTQRGAFQPSPGGGLDQAMRTKQVAHTADLALEHASYPPAKLGGARSYIAVPMIKDGELVGAIAIYRQEVRPFTDKQIELVKNFAAQAVIAIENARLLSELRESLEQQTATADVLRVISSWPGELELVFEAMLTNAIRLCEAKFGVLYLYEDGRLRFGAAHDVPSAFAEARGKEPFTPALDSGTGKVVATKQAVQIADLAATQSYSDRNPVVVAAVEMGGVRTALSVPMLRDNALVGVISIYRKEVRPFTDKQTALLQNFAAQAVIAIENARLLSELRQRTADLSESLDQQTASSEVLKVISSAPGELNAVFEAILSNATRICEAAYGTLLLRENGAFRRAAQCNAPQDLIEEFLRNPVFVPLPNNPLDRVLKTKETVHTPDVQADSNLGVLADARTLLNVPMLSHGELIGAISIYRQEVRPFTEKQIVLLQNFAAQAVIAIENARLLNELRESLEQQTASADVLRIISSSPEELKLVFATILDKALHLCEAAFGVATTYDGERFECAAERGVPDTLAAYFHAGMDQPRPGDAHWRLAAGEDLIHNLDQKDEDAYRLGNPLRRAVVDLGGARSTLVVALRKDKELLGALTVYRKEVRPFTDQQIALLQSFAAQAVIAIENARLLNELRQRTEEVVRLNAQLEARVADQVGEIERMGRLRRFLPPQVADLIVASGTEKQLESHRREITALFCDLRGFTGFSESSDPEDVMLLLRQYHEAIGEIIIKYSGTLERYAGDGVMVVFNDPVPVDNPALQAVRMALEMRQALGVLIEKWRRLGHDLGFGIGIAHGYATLGTIGFEGRFDYAAIGTVSNVASRLCDEAKPGQILISPRVLMAVEDAVAVELVGDFELKGISRPLAAYNVVSGKREKRDLE